jgi:uncharacterized protein DUF4105
LNGVAARATSSGTSDIALFARASHELDSPRAARTKSRMRRVVLLSLALVLAAGCAWLAFRLFVLQPTNQRDWEYGMQLLPEITISGDVVAVRHERDYRWSTDGPRSSEYIDRTYDVRRLERVWFVVEPFTLPSFNDFQGMAHTYFVFDFQDQPPVAISVESRRERGQGFDPVRGLFNEYELIYIWGTEQDLTGRRAVLENNQLYMYPVVGPLESGRKLFLEMAAISQSLETQPRFYNSITSNCTSELARVANEVQPGAIPPNIGMILPGYADQVLYEGGFIPRDAPLETIRQRYAIRDTVVSLIDKPDFSGLLRSKLLPS